MVEFIGSSVDEWTHDLKIYPNPADQELFILNQNIVIKSVKIYDGSNHLVKLFDNSAIYDVSDISDGLYYCIVEDNTERLKTFKLIIHH